MFPANSEQAPNVLPFSQISFAGGMNSATSALDRLGEQEAIDIQNFRFDETDSLITRFGTTRVIDKISAANIPTRITSIYRAIFNNGTFRDFFTTDNNVYEISAGAAVDRTGAYAMTVSDTFTQWKMFDDLAIGVPRFSTPFRAVAGAGNVVDLGGSPPFAKYIEVWNNRVWLVGGTDSTANNVYGSALGNAEDWTTAGAAGTVVIGVDVDDGDFITGIVAFRERLFVFKRNRIYTIQAVGGAFSTDATALSVELYSSSIGCVSAYSIQPVLDDVLFLAEGGVASLVASERVGDFNSALLSRNIRELRTTLVGSLSDGEISSGIVEEHNQYWIMIGSTGTFVLDYRRIQEGIVRWTKYVGLVNGDVFAAVGSGTYYVGVRRTAGAYIIVSYVTTPTGIFDDNINGTDSSQIAVARRIQSRIYDCGLPFIRKEFHRLFVDFVLPQSFGALNNTVVTITYKFDNDLTLTDTFTATLVPANTLSGATFYLNSSQVKFNRKFNYSSIGRRATMVDFVFTDGGLDQAYGIKGITLFFTPLTEKRATFV